MPDCINFTQQIKIQRQFMLATSLWSVVILLIGVGISMYFYLWGKGIGEGLPEFLKMGPAFISSAVTAFPLKIVFECRGRIANFKAAQETFPTLSKKEQKIICFQLVTENMKGNFKLG